LDLYIAQSEEKMRDMKIFATPDIDLVLELTMDDNGEPCCGYYLVNHSCRTLFWWDPFDIYYMLDDVQGATSKAHIRELSATLIPG
jgi:hypothetical protein